SNHGENEVEPQVSYSQGELLIELKDKDGKAPSLKTSHEKIMHLIIMSSDLNDYYHLHPEAEGDGKFVQKIDLSDGGYKVFRSEEHTSELQSRFDLVCRLLLEKKK